MKYKNLYKKVLIIIINLTLEYTSNGYIGRPRPRPCCCSSPPPDLGFLIV